ncbi:MAG: calcium/sodium antiporter [Pirellulaceae bacterium]
MWLVAGLVVLSGGAELLVRGASKLAAAMGISPLVVGLTVVAFGTSAPELVVCLQSTFSGQPDVALGNVVGSNIFNVLFILGISALIVPLSVSQQLVRWDVPLLVGLSFLVLGMAIDGRIGRLDGLLLSTGMVVYTVWAVIQGRREQANVQAQYEAEFGAKPGTTTWQSIAINVLLFSVGLGMLVLGSRWFVDSAVILARELGVSELVIGLTIVAAGTSLPEVATSIMAAIRGERDIAVGNVVGSNLFNLMAVLGITSFVSPQGVAVSEAALWLDLPVMVAVAVACLPIFFTGHLIARWEGGLLLFYYVAYTTAIILAATAANLAEPFNWFMLGLVIPLTSITLLTGVVRYWRAGDAAK